MLETTHLMLLCFYNTPHMTISNISFRYSPIKLHISALSENDQTLSTRNFCFVCFDKKAVGACKTLKSYKKTNNQMLPDIRVKVRQ